MTISEFRPERPNEGLHWLTIIAGCKIAVTAGAPQRIAVSMHFGIARKHYEGLRWVIGEPRVDVRPLNRHCCCPRSAESQRNSDFSGAKCYENSSLAQCGVSRRGMVSLGGSGERAASGLGKG